jgi:hypothetical protein
MNCWALFLTSGYKTNGLSILKKCTASGKLCYCLGEHTYNGSPFPPHAKLPVDNEHFAAWMALFTKTVDELFTGGIKQQRQNGAPKKWLKCSRIKLLISGRIL